MPKVEPTPRASESLPFTLADSIDVYVADTVPGMPTPARPAAFNAIRHLKRAWLLLEHDQAMAALRCITAEEEAATAVFRALQRRKYRHASKLDIHNHLHKNAVFAFFEAIMRTISKFAHGLPEIQLFVDNSSRKPRLAVRERFHDGPFANLWIQPQPPLGFVLESGQIGKRGNKDDFADGVREIVKEAKAGSLREFLRERANQRNRILYATRGGFYDVGMNGEQGFYIYRDRVFSLLRAYLLIDQYKQHQLFVQQ